MQILTGYSNLRISPSRGGSGPPSNIQCYLGLNQCPYQMASHSVNGFNRAQGCDRQTDRPRADTSFCRNRRNGWHFQQWRLIMTMMMKTTTTTTMMMMIIIIIIIIQLLWYCHHRQESRAVVRKSCDVAAVLFVTYGRTGGQTDGRLTNAIPR